MTIKLSTKCKTCGHDCHCHRKDCPGCVNDVCTKCVCDNAVGLETDARKWAWEDSGIEQGFAW